VLDLGALRPCEFELQVKHPGTREPLVDSEGAPVVIRLVGQDSPQFMAVQRVQADRRFARQESGTKLTAADLDAETTETVAACTVGWSGLALDGEPFEWSDENARRLYGEWTWIRDQAHRAIAVRANFFSS